MELADMQDLGSCAARRVGSSPTFCTMNKTVWSDREIQAGGIKMNDNFMFGVIFSGMWALIGVLFFVIGSVMFRNRKKKQIRCTSKTYGTVMDMIRHEHYESDSACPSISFYPVLGFDIGEQRVTRKYTYGSAQPKYTIGQTVEIYYNPANYEEFYIAGDALPKTLAVIFTAVGCVAIVIAVISAILIF